MSDFRKALLWTAVPLVVMALLGLIPGFGFSMGIAGMAILAAFIVGLVFLLTKRRQLAAGVFTGMAIGIVALGATCFAGPFRTG